MQTSRQSTPGLQSRYQERLLYRSLGSRSPFCQFSGLYSDKHWIDDLDIVEELKGHAGCVNALCWSQSGNLLASGSDDTHVNIYSYQSEADKEPFHLKTTIHTGHRANIFSVKFMPHTGDRTVATCSADHTVRVFDLEYSNKHDSRTNINNDVSLHHPENTNCRVYRSHTDSVKRIITESSPYLFLTCSEDGDVRRWDTREPSASYPRPRTRGSSLGADIDSLTNFPPPLISYRRHRVELNTISCSRNQPHYIALGGNHIHCFLHDGRMAGRDLLSEQGVPYSSPRAAVGTLEDDNMDSATRCVRRFAPYGKHSWNRLRSQINHITACKISDYNPNEMIVSWSGDHIYSFDLIKNPDAREAQRRAEIERSLEPSTLKRKRSGTPDLNTEQGRRQITSTEDLTTSDTDSASERDDEASQFDLSRLTSDERDASEIAIALTNIDYLLRGDRIMESPENTQRILQKIENIAGKYTEKIREALRSWRYPLNPDPVETSYQEMMRNIRQNAYRYTQVAWGIANAYLKRYTNTTDVVLNDYPDRSLERGCPDDKSHFNYEFMRAIIAYVKSGRDGLINAFTQPPGRRNPRLYPIARDALPVPAEQTVIQHLLRFAGNYDIMDLDADMRQPRETRCLFKTQRHAVEAFRRVICESSVGPSSQPIDDAEAHHFWLLKVGRSVMERAERPLLMENVNIAFGGFPLPQNVLLKFTKDEVDEDVDLEELQESSDMISSPTSECIRLALRLRSTANQNEESPNDDSASENPSHSFTALSINQLDGQAIAQTGVQSDSGSMSTNHQANDITVSEEADQGHREGTESINHATDDNGDDSADDDSDDDNGNDDNNNDLDDDNNDDDDDHHDSDFGDDVDVDDDGDDDDVDDDDEKKELEQHAPFSRHMKRYMGHCNVQTVKDVNYFGQNDEYVVSGSDTGHLFIWDKKTAKVVNILAGDNEVVNVIQGMVRLRALPRLTRLTLNHPGHPYEPTLAVSGIDNTVKIFSPDRNVQRLAFLGTKPRHRTSRAHRWAQAAPGNIAAATHPAAEDTGDTQAGPEGMAARLSDTTDNPMRSTGDWPEGSNENEGGARRDGTANPSADQQVSSDEDDPYHGRGYGLGSRKRMHEKNTIILENRVMRERTNQSTLFAVRLPALFASVPRDTVGFPAWASWF
ncbi:hypothetical protein KEM56_000835 [Ascosphaera pollenicola]|nr:hypothetical protein KEM56_000835 [Ascosphaera pollenicola]